MRKALTSVPGGRPDPPPARVALDSRRPLLLGEAAHALVIAAGYADLFAVPLSAGKATGPRRHLCRIEAGGLLLGLARAGAVDKGEGLAVIAVGGPDTEATVLERERIGDLGRIEAWVRAVSAALVGSGDPAGDEIPLGETVVLEAEQRRRGPARGVAWTSVQTGRARFMDLDDPCAPGQPPLPITSDAWLQAVDAAGLLALGREQLIDFDPLPSLDRFHAIALAVLEHRFEAAMAGESQRLDESAQHSSAQAVQFFDELAAVITPRIDPPVEAMELADPLLLACRAAGAALGVSVTCPAGRIATARGLDDVREIARASGLRMRRVLLRGDWWRRAPGPLVAWRAEDSEPLALVPVSAQRYALIDSTTGARRKVDAAAAATLAPEAAMFYPSLPARPLSALDLMRFCAELARRDGARVLLAALATGAITLAAPIITEALIDSVIPRAQLDQLAYCAAALVLAAVGMVGMQATQALAMLRLEGLLDWRLQAAVLDRLLRLPVGFFRPYTVGDLADRTMGIEAIRRVLTGRTIRGVLAGTFSLLSFALMFYYDAGLAAVAAALALLRGGIVLGVSAVRLRHEHRHFDLQGKVQGLVLQLLAGIGKLRVASATTRALAVWAHDYARQKRHFVASQRAANLLGVFDLAFPTLATVVIFALSEPGGSGVLAADTGRFLAFFVAFGQSLATLGEMGAAVGDTLVAVPRFARVRPLLREPPETADRRGRSEIFSGAFELGQVTVRYQRTGPPVLNNVSIRVGKQEFVALVGPSGAGKSTIFRLLLGFEKPEAGAIFFDGKSLDGLDISAVRRQIGVVLQNGRLTSGSLYENICGGAQLPLEQAWEAARLAGLDADIQALPMGMHTMITEGISTLSGGQRQKLMIARALVNRPRILLLDEATSALDNRTQAIVSASLAKLNVTRFVIAHRLSTVKSADRIIVVAGGEVAEAGTFAELTAAKGLFAEFAQRQLL